MYQKMESIEYLAKKRAKRVLMVKGVVLALMLLACATYVFAGSLGNSTPAIVKYTLAEKLSPGLSFTAFKAQMLAKCGFIPLKPNPYVFKPKDIDFYYCKLVAKDNRTFQVWRYDKKTGVTDVFTNTTGKAWSDDSLKKLLSICYTLAQLR